MQIELTNDQAAMLRKLLENALRELKVEVRRTETRKYHDELQLEEAEMERLLEALGSAD